MEKPKQLPNSSPEQLSERQKVLADSTAERNRLRDTMAQADQSLLVIEFLQAKEGSESVVSYIVENLKSAKAPKALIDLIQRDFAEPLARANEALSKANDTLDRKLPIVKQRLADSKKLHKDVLGVETGQVKVDDVERMRQVKHAVDWACTHVAKKVLDKEFEFTRKLLAKDENVGKVELTEKYIRDLQAFDVSPHVQTFRKAGWNEATCKQFEQTLRQMTKEAITVETAKVEFLKKTKK